MLSARPRASLVAAVLLCRAALACCLDVPVGAEMVEVDGRVEVLGVGRFQKDNPRQHPLGRIRLGVGGDLGSHLRLQTGFTGTAGGTPRDSDGAGIYDFGHTRQDRSPSLEIDEAYVDVFLEQVDLRLGMQKFAWGRLDGVQPSDLLNPEKLVDPLLDDEIDRQIAIPAAAVTWNVPDLESESLPRDLRLTLVGVPLHVPFRIADDDERWYPPLARVPDVSHSMGFVVRNQGNFREGNLPERDLDNGALAARVVGFLHGFDFGVTFYEGFDPQPSFEAEANGFVQLDPLQPNLLAVRSEVDIFPIYDRIRAIGADLSTSVLGATLRGEAAYVVGRLYPRAVKAIVDNPHVGFVDPLSLVLGIERPIEIGLDPVNVERDGLEWGVNGDMLLGDTFLLAQMMQTVVLGNQADLLISDTETRFALTVRQTFLDERLEAELIGLYGLQGVYGVAHPRVTYDVTDNLDCRLGVMILAGHEESILGQYAGNDQAYVRLRYSF